MGVGQWGGKTPMFINRVASYLPQHIKKLSFGNQSITFATLWCLLSACSCLSEIKQSLGLSLTVLFILLFMLTSWAMHR